jgi:hypothetical protein
MRREGMRIALSESGIGVQLVGVVPVHIHHEAVGEVGAAHPPRLCGR